MGMTPLTAAAVSPTERYIDVSHSTARETPSGQEKPLKPAVSWWPMPRSGAQPTSIAIPMAGVARNI